jgi:hypothetical protein
MVPPRKFPQDPPLEGYIKEEESPPLRTQQEEKRRAPLQGEAAIRKIGYVKNIATTYKLLQ